MADYELGTAYWGIPTVSWFWNGPANYLSAIQRAFSDWDININLDFTQAASAGSANMVLAFGAIDGPGNTAGLASYSFGGNNLMTDATITFDTAETWDSTFLYEVALHEIGHAIGLDHSTNPAAMMYPVITATGLMSWDIAGAQVRYGPESTPTTQLFTTGNNYVTLTTPGGTWSALAGNDTVIGTSGADNISGDDGYDNLYGGAGSDTLYGGALEDILVGDAGDDFLYGGDGGDVLSELYDPVNSGNDTFDGGNGVDIMYSAAGNDTVSGGTDTANNYASLGDGTDTYSGSAGTDVVLGGNGNDTINGNNGDDSLYGEAGDDTVYGGAGIDLLSGSTGNDTLDGGANNDLLVGDDGNDTLLGGTGLDVLHGFAGDDILNGGTGGDVDGIFGGSGNDSFQVGGAGYGIDYIWDFVGGAGLSDRLLVASGATITSQSTSSGNYYINFNNGSQAVIVGRTSVLAEDIVLNGF